MSTDTLIPVEEDLLTLNARAFATAWCNAFLATSDDPERPALFRTLSLEWLDDGMHMVATNGHALFRSWVGEGEDRPWPDTKVAPNRSIVVMDTEGFGIGFMKTLLRVTGDEGREHEQLSISIAKSDEGATLSLGEEFVSERVILRACGQRIDLRVYAGEYPKWRQLQFGVDKRELVDTMSVGPKLFKLLGKLIGPTAIDLEFSGHEKAIAFVARTAVSVVPYVVGLIMPMRRPSQDDE